MGFPIPSVMEIQGERGGAAAGERGESVRCAHTCTIMGGIDLDSNKVGFIIVQVKNDRNIHQSESEDGAFLLEVWIPLRVAFLTRFRRQRRRKISHSHHPYLLSQQGPPPWARGPRKIYKSPSEGAVVLGEYG